MRYAVFLRGINVGSIKVPMADLKTCLEKLGYSDIKTYLQTGNITLSSDKSAVALKTELESVLTKTFSYQSYVLVYDHSQLEGIVDNYPFADADETTHRYALLCQDDATLKELTSFQKELDPKQEKIAIGNQVLYWQVKRAQRSIARSAR